MFHPSTSLVYVDCRSAYFGHIYNIGRNCTPLVPLIRSLLSKLFIIFFQVHIGELDQLLPTLSLPKLYIVCRMITIFFPTPKMIASTKQVILNSGNLSSILILEVQSPRFLNVLLSVTWRWMHHGNTVRSFVLFLCFHLLQCPTLGGALFPPVLCLGRKFYSLKCPIMDYLFSYFAKFPVVGICTRNAPPFIASLYSFQIIRCQSSLAQLRTSSLSPYEGILSKYR